jgi:hypothetical protein
MAQSLNGLPGTPEVWFYQPTGWYFLVYFVPGTDIPLAYTTSPEEMQAAFGPDQTIVVDRTIADNATLKAAGAIGWGLRSQINNDTEDPFDAWVAGVEKQAAVRPWLRDPEVLGLIAQALVEGRTVSEAEFQQTNWWQSHNEEQRNWMLLTEADPATAEKLKTDQVLVLKNMFAQAGASEVPEETLMQMATQYLSGNWTENYLIDQVRALSDPASGIPIDSSITAGGLANTTRDQELQAADLFSQWLGPIYGSDQAAIQSWAGKLRNDPDAEVELIEHLKQQRLALLPEYENPNLSYNDIVGPWRGFWSQQWGQPADEMDPFFMSVVRSGDATEAAKMMRDQGLVRGVGKVMNDLVSTAGQVVGPQVRSIS